MNFQLYPSNFQSQGPILFQTNDFSAKAKQIYEFVTEGFGNSNFYIAFALSETTSGILDPNQDLKQLFEAGAKLFIVLNDQNAPQEVPQGVGVPISVYKLEGDQQIGIVQEYVDPNLNFGQYLIQLRQQYNVIADAFNLFDHEGKPLTDDQNYQIGIFINYPMLNMVLINNQFIQPLINNNTQQNEINQFGLNQNSAINPSQMPYTQPQQQLISDQQLLNSQQYYNEINEKQQYDPQNQVIISQPSQLPMQQLQPQQQQQQQQQQQLLLPQSQPQVVPIDQKIQQSKDCVAVLKNITLYFDPLGEFITYKYHHPIQLSGSIRKSQSSSSKKFSNSKYNWISVHNQKYEYAEIDEYSFGIKWEGGNSSQLKIKQQ